MPPIWQVFASAQASILAGLLLLLLLFMMHRWRKDRALDGAGVGPRITACILLGITLYSLIICVFFHFFLGIEISDSVELGFGDDRVAWLMLGLTIDVGVRVYKLFTE